MNNIKKNSLKILMLTITLALLVSGCQLNSSDVRVKKVERKSLEAFVFSNATIEPESYDEVYFDKGTRIDNIFVKDGDVVNEDQKLVLFNADKIRKSNIDGVITQMNIKKGMTIDTTQIAMVIIDTTKLIVKADVRQIDVPNIREGQQAIITGDSVSTDKKLTGKVESISNIAKKRGDETFVEVKVKMDGKMPEVLKAGMIVNCDIKLSSKENVLVISYDAVKEVGSDKYVFVVKDGKLEEKKVNLGVSQGVSVEVKEGIQEGDQVVIDPKADFSNGMKVKIIETITTQK